MVARHDGAKAQGVPVTHMQAARLAQVDAKDRLLRLGAGGLVVAAQGVQGGLEQGRADGDVVGARSSAAAWQASSVVAWAAAQAPAS
ncbi:hypothetical protein BX281_0252 [Streptomyces sp. Ag82_O1-15]|nr:hypothetical protein BX281_0252 [Streptomyces sp. Ag82_O1-15]